MSVFADYAARITSIAGRIRLHIDSRGGPAHQNSFWVLALEAARELEAQYLRLENQRETIERLQADLKNYAALVEVYRTQSQAKPAKKTKKKSS